MVDDSHWKKPQSIVTPAHAGVTISRILGEEPDIVSSRDRSGRPGGNDRSSNYRRSSESAPPRQRRDNEAWDIDPAEIDRYLSGRPTREQEASGTSRVPRAPRQGTAGQLDQLQRQRGQASQPRRPARPAPAGRQQFTEPEEPDYPDTAYSPRVEPADPIYDDQQEGDRFGETARVRPQRRQARPAPRQSRQPVYHDDEELYADDPYLTYDDDFDAPPRQQRPRPRPQVSKPSLPSMPKLSMPRAISQAELVNDVPSLALIGAAVLSVAVMAIVVSNRLDALPSIIPTHVSASGVGEALRGRSALWSVPILAGALSLMNIAASWFLARLDMFASRFLLSATLLVQFIAWIAVITYLW